MFSPIQNNEYTFHVKVQGEKTKEQYEGTFTVKCILNQEEMVDVALRTDRYCGGSKNLANQYILVNRSIAELEVRIIKDEKTGKMKAPTWWIESDSGRLLYDTNVVYKVFADAMKAEEQWYKKLADKVEEAEKQVTEAAQKEASK